MLKKIVLAFFFCILTLNAELADNAIEEKYIMCEKEFDICLETCEKTDSDVNSCIQTCDEKLYKCNQEIEETFEEPKDNSEN